MSIKRVAIDLAKDNFRLHGVNEHGKAVLREPVKRARLAETIQNIPACEIVMEACGSAHYWARLFEAMGHQVKLISPQHVKPFVMRNKNDANDARAICEAADRPDMRFVPIKSVAQQEIQAIHRIRSLLIKNRTALVNQIRGLLAEQGIVLPQAVASLRQQMPIVIEDTAARLTPVLRELMADQYTQLQEMDERIADYDRRLQLAHRQSEASRRIEAVPGVGLLTATAMVAAVGKATDFRNGRQFAAWLGLTPMQHSSGGKERLLGISKRGDTYLRTLLIHGARAVVVRAASKSDPLSQWINRIRARRGLNIAIVAYANKMARMIWVLLARETEFQMAA